MDALYAHFCFDGLDLDARSQWVGKGKKNQHCMLSATKQAISIKLSMYNGRPFFLMLCYDVMKNFNRRDGHHGSKCRKLAQHARSHGTHTFTHALTSTQLQPCGTKRQLSY